MSMYVYMYTCANCVCIEIHVHTLIHVYFSHSYADCIIVIIAAVITSPCQSPLRPNGEKLII